MDLKEETPRVISTDSLWFLQWK